MYCLRRLEGTSKRSHPPSAETSVGHNTTKTGFDYSAPGPMTAQSFVATPPPSLPTTHSSNLAQTWDGSHKQIHVLRGVHVASFWSVTTSKKLGSEVSIFQPQGLELLMLLPWNAANTVEMAKWRGLGRETSCSRSDLRHLLLQLHGWAKPTASCIKAAEALMTAWEVQGGLKAGKVGVGRRGNGVCGQLVPLFQTKTSPENTLSPTMMPLQRAERPIQLPAVCCADDPPPPQRARIKFGGLSMRETTLYAYQQTNNPISSGLRVQSGMS